MDVRGFVDWVFKRMPMSTPELYPTAFDNRLYFAEKKDDGTWRFHPVDAVSTGFVNSAPATILRGSENVQADST